MAVDPNSTQGNSFCHWLNSYMEHLRQICESPATPAQPAPASQDTKRDPS